MYSGGDLAKLLKDTSLATTANVQAGQHPPSVEEEEGNKQRYPACLKAYLTQLNNLARNDLNFQNLLVLHNLVNLVLDFGDYHKRPADQRFLPRDQRENCLAELLHSLGKQKTHRERGCAASDRPAPDTSRQATQRNSFPEVVMGYPAAGHRYPLQPDRSVQQYVPLTAIPWSHPVQPNEPQGQPVPQYYQNHWTVTPPWNQWNRNDGFAHGREDAEARRFRMVEDVESTRREQRDVVEGHEQHEFVEERVVPGYVFQKCSSWPDSINLPSSDGAAVGLEESSESLCHPDDGSQEVDVPYQFEQEVRINCQSDLERFIDAATPSVPLPAPDNVSSQVQLTLTMEDVWRVYQIPCLYGLQVPFFRGGKGISFAHFVPSLSAIRLFMSASLATNEQLSQADTYICDMPEYPEVMQLVFEFFETSKPHVRRPLTDEIDHLSQTGISGKKLPNLQLSEIHPASWFAVAWYPIYCIPEGKLRTSFLTFHSFGNISQTMNNSAGEDRQLKAYMIGLKFLSLSQEAWMRPRTDTYDKSIPSLPSDVHEQHNSRSESYPTPGKFSERPRYRNGMHSYQGHDRHSPSMYDRNVVSDVDHPTHKKPRDLEDKIDLLQRNAERLARASCRTVVQGSGSASDLQKHRHSDFEFFHLRS